MDFPCYRTLMETTWLFDVLVVADPFWPLLVSTNVGHHQTSHQSVPHAARVTGSKSLTNCQSWLYIDSKEAGRAPSSKANAADITKRHTSVAHTNNGWRMLCCKPCPPILIGKAKPALQLHITYQEMEMREETRMDAKSRRQVHAIKDEIAKLGKDFARFHEKIKKLSAHIEQAQKDVVQVKKASEKIVNRFSQVKKGKTAR